ncbi:hypothetical protein FPZ24_11050 [Sphingomonas panacisoli]|uniref:Uncharacterized protein n=1 Tax=Sphingomonas panacisoli TaxID=1813879 RepID=A0A5B8LIH3_9SPHN|nr:hypothetical protein [Sphingomonas panacisoli]QDZ07953.1 hypothetical protein FPZ24_11050 [Sphingomonas panacisoli]
MAFDLQKMLHRKGEFESARLDAFAFHVRARTMRALAAALAIDADELVKSVAAHDDDAILDQLGETHGRDRVDTAYIAARAAAEAEAIAEFGDPTPVRLA